MGDGVEPEGDAVVKVSKQLSWVLRRGAIQCGVWIDRDHGWVAIQDLLTCRYFSHLGEEGLMAVVAAANKEKPRYELRKLPPQQRREIRALWREDPLSFVIGGGGGGGGAAAGQHQARRSATSWARSGRTSAAASTRSGGSELSDRSSCSSCSSSSFSSSGCPGRRGEEGEVLPSSVLRVGKVHGARGAAERRGAPPKPAVPSAAQGGTRRAKVEGASQFNKTGRASDKQSAGERKRAAPVAASTKAQASWAPSPDPAGALRHLSCRRRSPGLDAERRPSLGNKSAKSPPAPHAQCRRSATSEACSQGHRIQCTRRQEEGAIVVAQQGGPEKVAAPTIRGKASAAVAALRLEYVGLWEAQAPSEETLLELARNRLLHVGFAPEEVLQVRLDGNKKHCNVDVLLQSPCSSFGQGGLQAPGISVRVYRTPPEAELPDERDARKSAQHQPAAV